MGCERSQGTADGIRTTCPYCGVGCGVIAKPDGAVVGDPDHPANRGRLCSKGAALADTLDDRRRLLRPTIDSIEASWDAALDLVATTFLRTIERHGPEAVALYISGQFLTEDYYVANKLMKGFIGSANIDTNSRLCMASSVAGHIRAFGEDIVSGCYADIDQADLVVLVGSNAAWCHPVLFRRLMAAKEQRGTRVVVVDPRRTASCEIADLHLPIRIGSDVALFNGLLVHLARVGAIDAAWIAQFADGLDAALAAAQTDLSAVAATTGVAPAEIATFYGWFAATDRTMSLYSQGVNQSAAGTDKVNAIINCHLATGRIGRPGTGPFSLTGQPNAMGGREVGGLANQLAAHMGFARPDIDRVRRFWKAPRMATKPGLRAVELFDAVLDGRVKALWIMGTNPAASMPRAARVRSALATCPFVVIADCWPNDTTRLARVVLPAAGWGEKNGTVTNSERRISRQRAIRPPPGEARPDWWMLKEVARRMGWQAAFAYRRPAEIFREHSALSGFENNGSRAFDIGAFADLDDDAYERLEPTQWPIRRGHPRQASDQRLLGRGGFATANGRARLVPTPWRPLTERPDERRPLLLNTGRIRDQWHTMTRTGAVPRLMEHIDAPFVSVHPDDARRFALVDGALAKVESRHGIGILRVRLSDDQRPGEVFAAMHWNDHFASCGPIDRIVGSGIDPVSGQPALKATPVSVTPVVTRWHGLLLRRSGAEVAGDFHWWRIPVETGHVFELAGLSPFPGGAEAERFVDTLLAAPAEGELIVYADPQRASFRYACILDGKLEACLYVGRSATTLPDRRTMVPLLGGAVDPDLRAGLVAPRPLIAAARTQTGPIVCACFAVGFATIRRAIVEQRAGSVAQIGDLVRAGTNCGACIPELREILRSRPVEAQA